MSLIWWSFKQHHNGRIYYTSFCILFSYLLMKPLNLLFMNHEFMIEDKFLQLTILLLNYCIIWRCIQPVLPSPFSILMKSRYDLPSSFRAKNSLRYFSIETLRKFVGLSGSIRLGAGPSSESRLELWNVAMESLSFVEFTVALCSMLRYMPLLKICRVNKEI